MEKTFLSIRAPADPGSCKQARGRQLTSTQAGAHDCIGHRETTELRHRESLLASPAGDPVRGPRAERETADRPAKVELRLWRERHPRGPIAPPLGRPGRLGVATRLLGVAHLAAGSP